MRSEASGAGTYRVIQWATGKLGTCAVAGIVGHRDLELVGAWVHSAEKEGRDVGELCGLAPLGVRATRDKDALLSMPADCVCYTPYRPSSPPVEEPAARTTLMDSTELFESSSRFEIDTWVVFDGTGSSVTSLGMSSQQARKRIDSTLAWVGAAFNEINGLAVAVRPTPGVPRRGATTRQMR